MEEPTPQPPAYETLRVETEGPIAIVTLNRPRAFNALSMQCMKELHRAFDAIAADSTIRGVIITGARVAFAMGADIPDILATGSPGASEALSRRGQQLFSSIEHLGKPVIAAINGLAMGGGLEIALACTLRVASDKATFALPEINLGIIPGYGGTQRLPRMIGKGRAMEMILTGDPIDAAEALRIGLVNRVVAREEVMNESKALLEKLLAKAPQAMRSAMRAVNEGLESTIERGFGLESSLFGLVRATADSTEGLTAFLEKRAPEFGDR